MKHRMTLNRMAIALLVIAVAFLVTPAQAEENAKLAELKTSLNSVPDDVSLYLGMFRAGEQIEAIGNSKAWEKLVHSPAVQLGLTMYQMQSANPDTPAGQAARFLQDAQVKDLLALLADMFDDEAFIYADQTLVKSLGLMQKFQWFGHMQHAHNKKSRKKIRAIVTKLRAADDDDEREKLFKELHKQQQGQAKQAIKLAAKNLDAIKVPTIVFGSKLDDTDRAEINLGKLEFILGMGLMHVASQQPEIDFREVLKREKIDGGNFLVITLSGKMIPWEDGNPLAEMAENDENAAKVVEKIKSENLVIAMGVKDGYMLVSIGSSLDEIKKFGEVTSLVTRSEMAKIEPYADKPITDITYVSKELVSLNFAFQKDVQAGYKHAKKGLDKIGQDFGLSQEEKDQIISDLEELGTQLKSVLPKPGAMAAVAFLTDEGQEQYMFSWTTCGASEKPLELLNHVGGSPLLAIVSVCPLDVETYDAMVHWVNVGWGYFNKYGLPHMPEKKRKHIKEAVELFGPIVTALHETTREKFLPAFGGEFAIQADAELKLSSIPKVNKTMPMIEPAIILSVKDSDLMHDAITSYWEIFEDAIKLAGTKCEKMAKFKLPEPATVKDDVSTMYVFSLPSKCPVSGEVKPTVGLGKDTLVFAATPDAAKRLMTKTPLACGGVLSDAKKPRLSASYFAWKDLVTAGTPWVMFGVDKAIEECKDGQCPLPPDAIRSQAKTILEVLAVLQTITVETYRDGKVTVQHSKATIKDID